MRIRSVAVFALAAVLSGPAVAAPAVDLVADLVESMPKALVTDCTAWQSRPACPAGGVRKSAVFEHPASVGAPARAVYSVRLPAARPGERLVLAFDTALTDGVKYGLSPVPADGVRFAVEVDGRERFSTTCAESRWTPACVDLSDVAGRAVRIGLVVHANRNLSYDWAVWGDPRILHFRSATPPAGSVAAPVGAVTFRYRPGVRLNVTVTADGGAAPVAWHAPAGDAVASDALAAFDFSFPGARTVTFAAEPADAVERGSVRLGAYPPILRLVRVSPERAVPLAGQACRIAAHVRNEGRGVQEAGQAQVRLSVDGASLAPRQVARLTPGASWRAAWAWTAPTRPSDHRLEASLGSAASAVRAAFSTYAAAGPATVTSLATTGLRVELVRSGNGVGYARVIRPGSGSARPDRVVAVWRPLLSAVVATAAGPRMAPLAPRVARASRREALLECSARDAAGVPWGASVRIALDPSRALARLTTSWTAGRASRVLSLMGPNVYVGDGTTGEAKHWALLPGVDHLFEGEPSSSPRDLVPTLADRRTPDPRKLTAPFMAVSTGPGAAQPPSQPGRFYCPDALSDRPGAPRSYASDATDQTTLALWWDPHQRWDGRRTMPSVRFSSPNADEGMANHRMALFVPSVPEHVAENAAVASKPYPMRAGQTVRLTSTLALVGGPVLAAWREWYRDHRGTVRAPEPPPWPRSFQQELDVCREGLLRSVWDAATEKWRHCIDWEPTNAPGLAALLWMDSYLAADPAQRARSMARAELGVRNVLRDAGPAGLMSPAACHILRWELPFLAGRLPEAMAGLEPQIRSGIAFQKAEGGWRFTPGAPDQTDLGRAGDSVLGTNVYMAALLLRYARITGDTEALAAGEKALAFMERFRVPRGAGTWECPMYEPDQLASAGAVGAYVEGFRASGNPRWLRDAVYWAESGLPFVYHWTTPGRPMMFGATTSNIGSTFYTHSWIGMPVQWVGLVYAYRLLGLADCLDAASPAAVGALRPVVGLKPSDWRRIAELITVSAMHQQEADGPRAGTYPDSITDFQKRNPPYLNPEDILVNVLALKGHDPDIRTARVDIGGRPVVVSTGARIVVAAGANGALRLRLAPIPGRTAHVMVCGLKASAASVDGEALTRAAEPVRTDPGWWVDDAKGRTYLVLPPRTDDGPLTLEVSGRPEG